MKTNIKTTIIHKSNLYFKNTKADTIEKRMIREYYSNFPNDHIATLQKIYKNGIILGEFDIINYTNKTILELKSVNVKKNEGVFDNKIKNAHKKAVTQIENIYTMEEFQDYSFEIVIWANEFSSNNDTEITMIKEPEEITEKPLPKLQTYWIKIKTFFNKEQQSEEEDYE